MPPHEEEVLSFSIVTQHPHAREGSPSGEARRKRRWPVVCHVFHKSDGRTICGFAVWAALNGVKGGREDRRREKEKKREGRGKERRRVGRRAKSEGKKIKKRGEEERRRSLGE